ncbi:hypothetical protein PCC7424_5414 (plasmid) [Gloeothece citriformis PCC 7424]|uniref:Uncharacterized protein n=1 Tax=Gloeothece citriformis (strain PCC 7424) TaxID=65393 RepID=B7KMG9_GLOC7|nr:hypothetical protein [Gloeothece citriformis]ACK73991.1 hypothetical protein PCC7424_5414 [Gloeothece citriformis PCC 7424]
MFRLDNLLTDYCYYPDGTMRTHHREHCLARGYTEQEIKEFERLTRQEIELKSLIEEANGKILKIREISHLTSAELTVEEELAEGWLNLDDLMIESSNPDNIELTAVETIDF